MIWNGYTPSTLLPVVGVIGVILIILYLLRVRRRVKMVPYLGLWKQISLKRRRWVENLRRLLSLLLWFIIVGLVALALMDPRVETDEEARRHVILVVDTSASMGATLDGEGCSTRFACAIQDAHTYVDNMILTDRMTIVEASGNVHATGPFTDDQDQLHEALNALSVHASTANIGDALKLANQLAEGRASAQIILLSDGQFEAKEADVSFIPLPVALAQKTYGKPAHNLAIEAFNVRRYISNRLAFEAFLSLHNGFDVPVTAKVQIFNLEHPIQALTDDYANNYATVIAEKTLTLASGESEVRLYDNLTLTAGRMAARVTIVDPHDAKDILPQDDVAYARVPDFVRPDILAVTPGNLYLEAALLLNENYRVTIARPNDVMTDGKLDLQPLAAAHDIVILDNSYRNLPEIVHEDTPGRLLFIHPRPGETPFEQSLVSDPIVERVNLHHPVSRWLSLKNLNIKEANIFKNVKSDDMILRAIEGPLIVSHKTDSQRVMAIGFSLVESDLIFRVALPVLMINAVDWFMNEGSEAVLAKQTGEAWHIRVPEGMQRATLFTPSWKKRSGIPAYNSLMTVYGDEAGIYVLRDEENETRTYEFAANFANPQESDMAQAQNKIVTAHHPEPSIMEASEADTPDALLRLLSRLPKSAQNIWIIALLLVSGLLFVEYLTWHRRWTV